MLTLRRALATVLVACPFVYGFCRVNSHPHPQVAWMTPRSGEHHPLVLSHQGGEGIYPTNTMLGFRESAKMGADVLDLDVHLSADGKLVVLHDDTVDRTTNGAGKVASKTLAELKKLDAGYRFTSDGVKFPFRGKGLTIPTLDEVLDEFPNTRLGIEIKPQGPCAAIALGQVLLQRGRVDDVLVSCFDDDTMEHFRATCPKAPTSATPSEVRSFVISYQLGLIDTYTPSFCCLQIPEKHHGWQLLTRELVQAAHRRGVTVIPWTINEAEDLRRIGQMGVDGINTNYPDRMLKIVGESPH